MSSENIVPDEFQEEGDDLVNYEGEHVTQRTILEVIDVDSGEIISAEEFFAQDEAVILNARRAFEMAYQAGIPKYTCLFCEQAVKISGRRLFERNLTVFFFAHQKDSDDCPIKTGVGMSYEEILAKKFNGALESKLHKNTKEYISLQLQTETAVQKQVKEVAVEKTFKDITISEKYRRPDVRAIYQNKSLVFELQLSSTFLSVVVGREDFYRQHQTYVIWVFVGFEEESNWQRLFEKDIYYGNKRNVFVLNNAAKQRSKELDELVFQCYWQIPKIVNGKVWIEWHKKFVTLDDLTFDPENYIAYYHDSDRDFYQSSSPEEQVIIDYWELQKKQYWGKIIDRINSRTYYGTAKKSCIEKLLLKQPYFSKILANELQVVPYTNEDLWGFKVETGEIVIEPKYSKVKQFIDGFAAVKKKHWGVVNLCGEKTVSFNYLFIQIFSKELIIVQDKNYLCGLIDSDEKIITPCEYDDILSYKNGKAKAKKYGNWGYIDESGNEIIPCIYTEFQTFIEGKAKVKKSGGYWGYIDQLGNEIISCKYDEIQEFIEGKAKAKKNNKWGYIDKSGSEIIPCEFDNIEDFLEGKAEAKKGRYWGLINESGNQIIPFEYDELLEFTEGKAKAKKNNKWGYIDELGNEIIPCEFDNIEGFLEGKAKAKKGGYWGLINESGNQIIPFEYDELIEFTEGKAKAKKGGWMGKWGYLDEAGNTIITLIYDEIEDFIEGRAKVKLDGKFGFINSEGCVIVPCVYDSINKFNESLAFAKKNNLWGRIDEFGNEIIPFEYTNIYKSIEGIRKAKKNEKFGFIDDVGNEIISFKYDEIKDFLGGKARARIDKKWGYLNEAGIEVISFDYDELYNFVDGKARVKRKGRWGYIDESGRELFEEISPLRDNIFKARKFEKWSLLNENHQQLVPYEYDEIQDFAEGKVKVSKGKTVDKNDNNLSTIHIIRRLNLLNKANYGVSDLLNKPKYGVFDYSGKEIIPCEYDVIQDFKDGKAKAIKNNKWGYINEQGNVIISFKYDEIQDFVDGKAIAKKNGRWGYIDQSGRELFSDITQVLDKLYKGKKFERWYLVNENHEPLTEDEYDEIQDFVAGKAKAKKNGRWGYFDEKGQWEDEILKVGNTLSGTITGIIEFGLFVKISSGNTGLLHKSKFRNQHIQFHPFDFRKGQKIEVVIDEVDLSKHRISFSIPKKEDFWSSVIVVDTLGLIVEGVIKNIKPYGLFVEIQEGVTGLLYVSKLKKAEGERIDLLEIYKIGESILVVIEAIDIDKRKMDLGVLTTGF